MALARYMSRVSIYYLQTRTAVETLQRTEDEHVATLPRTKRQEQAFARREQLIRTALRLFSEKGYRGASVRDIARSAGVNEALLYHYFKSKADLFRAVLNQYAPLRVFGATPPSETPLHPAYDSLDDALQGYGRMLVARIRENRAFIVTMLTEAPGDPELGAILSEFLQATNEEIMRFLSEYRQSGQIDTRIPIETAAHVLQGSLLFQFLTEVARAPTSPSDDDKVVSDIVSVLLAGLAPR